MRQRRHRTYRSKDRLTTLCTDPDHAVQVTGMGQIQRFSTLKLNGRCRIRKRPVAADDRRRGLLRQAPKVIVARRFVEADAAVAPLVDRDAAIAIRRPQDSGP
jgi:hypothetical protein